MKEQTVTKKRSFINIMFDDGRQFTTNIRQDLTPEDVVGILKHLIKRIEE